MKANSFSKSDVLRFSWETTKSRFFFLLGALIVAFFAPFIPLIFGLLVGESVPFLSLLFSFAGWLLQMLVSLGLIKVFLGICDEEEVNISDLFLCYPYLVRYIVALLLYVLIVMVGTLLLVVPGIYFAIRFVFHPFIIVDEDVGAIESLKRSWAITAGSVWNLILIAIIIMAVNFLGMLLLLVGMIFTYPFSIVAAAYIYRQLSGHGGVARRIHPTASSPASAAPTATYNPKDRVHERLDKLHKED